jgi:hypothetical protein
MGVTKALLITLEALTVQKSLHRKNLSWKAGCLFELSATCVGQCKCEIDASSSQQFSSHNL